VLGGDAAEATGLQVAERLRTIPGVLRVWQPVAADEGVLAIESPRGRDVRGEIFQVAAQQRWELRELRRVGMTLEEVFIRIVAGEEHPAEVQA